jgi:hypothetical protein
MMENINTWLHSNMKSNDEKLLNYTNEACINILHSWLCNRYIKIPAARITVPISISFIFPGVWHLISLSYLS